MPNSPGNHVLFVFLLVLSTVPARATSFTGELDPAPFDAATKVDTVGIGKLFATLDGNILTISGEFSGLSSPAIAAHLEMGLAEGVKGKAIADLSAARAVAGEIGGKVTLTHAQVEAAKMNALYVQIDSEKAPDGNLWGWLEISGN